MMVDLLGWKVRPFGTGMSSNALRAGWDDVLAQPASSTTTANAASVGAIGSEGTRFIPTPFEPVNPPPLGVSNELRRANRSARVDWPRSPFAVDNPHRSWPEGSSRLATPALQDCR